MTSTFDRYVALFLVACRVVSLHAVAVTPGPAGMPRRGESYSGAAERRLDLAKWNAYQLGWDAMVPMALLGVPAAQFAPPKWSEQRQLPSAQSLLALLILGYVSIFALVPLLAHKVERFHTFAAREMNICFKLSFFQVRA